MKKLICVLIMLFMVISCVPTKKKYRIAVSSWIGHNEIDLVRSWGPPQQVYETSGKRFLVYQKSQIHFSPGTQPTYYTTHNNLNNNPFYIGPTTTTTVIGGVAPRLSQRSCRTIFEVSNGKIVYWKFNGNACESK